MAVRVDPITSYRIPKPSGGTRIMARLTAHDAARWESLASRAVPAIERRLGETVMGNRARRGTRGPMLRPLGQALADAQRAARGLGRSTSLLLRTDVAAFYPSVTPSVLARTLSRVAGDSREPSVAADMLEGWGSEGYGGLPIGPEASAILANAVLLPVDEALSGVRFLRWVDDYLVVVADERGAAEALERIDVALEGQGLRRAGHKTGISEGGWSWLGRSGGDG